jgi:hypothetical protein
MLRDSLVQVYLSKSDDELLSLAADPDSLIEQARPILAEELGRRGLTATPAPAAVESQPPDFWSSAVGKFFRSVGDYLLCFAIAILGSNAILGDINPTAHTDSFFGLAAKIWVSCVTVAALLGFFVTRYRPTKMAVWIWILPVTLLIYRIVLYTTTRTTSIFGDSVLQHFVAPNCPESVKDCVDFSFFTILAARTLVYSLAAWVSLRFQRRPNSAKILET